MGIDGIGKAGSGPPVGTVDRAGSVSGPEPGSAQPGGAVQPAAGSQALQQLGRGEITLDAYLETRLTEATAHLEARLAPEQLEFVRSELREQLATDPVLVELVRRATGATPNEPGR